MYAETTRNIQVEVIPQYMSEQSHPEIPVYFYKYTVKVTNDSNHLIQLMDRHWIITDGRGVTEHVQGPGVVGQQPLIHPGQTYTYESGCPLPTKTGNMRGTYGIKTAEENFRIQIPLFFLRHPDTFN